MSVLETFYFAFKSDAKDVIKGTKDASKSANALEGNLLDTKKAADALSKSFLSSVQSASRNISGLLTIGALTARTLREAAQAEDLGRFAERLNQNVEEVATWGKLVGQTGGTAEGFRGTLEGLTNTLTNFAITGGGAAAETFARLGIHAFEANGQLKTATQLLPEIADAFQDISAEESANLGRRLGLDNATILLLQRGRDEIDNMIERQQRLGIVTEADTELVTAFNMAWRDTRTSFDSLVRTIGFSFLPALTDSQEILQELIIFLRENEELISDMFLSALVLLSPFIAKMALAVAPFALIALAIAAIGFAINDLKGYLQGYDSLIGRFIDNNREYVDGIKEAWSELTDSLSESYEYLRDEVLGKFIRSSIDAINRVRSAVGLDPLEGGSEIQSESEPPIGGNPFGGLVLGPDGHFIEATDTDNPLTFGLDLPPISGNVTNNNASTSVNVKVDVDARGTDADGVVEKFNDSLSGAMENTIANMSTAIQG